MKKEAKDLTIVGISQLPSLSKKYKGMLKHIVDTMPAIKTSSANYFTQLEPTKVHTNTPVNQFIHIYSFAIEPEKIEQPNGTCNFSELQEPLLHLTFNTPVVASTLYIYAVNYNILINSNGGSTLLHMLSKSIPSIFPNADCI